VRSARYKYIWYDDRPSKLYDLQQDPDEQHDLLGQTDAEQQTAPTLHRVLEEWLSSLTLLAPEKIEPRVGMDGEVSGRLRALGYVE
jgi:hypothetical protein